MGSSCHTVARGSRLSLPRKLEGPGLFDGLDDARDRASSAPDGASRVSQERAPLAERLRPRSLDEVVGQAKVVGSAGLLRRAIAEDRVSSLIFWGPPGTGKTTLARIIANETSSYFLPFSAVTSGIKEIKQVMAQAERLRHSGALLLFVDEIHRFNRAQQDAFLPYLERGDVVLIGATTENPSFELNGALLSRCRVVVLEPLAREDILVLLERALADQERGLGGCGAEVTAEALESIAQLSSGDARRALGLLELVVRDHAGEQSDDTPSASPRIDARDVEKAAQRKVLLYDKSGEEHFNLISALHKSLRESDADASVYWLLRMLEAGEDARYLARRLVRFASEDIGLADPQALAHTLGAWDAYHRLGPPEGNLALVQAAIYLALAPKSVAVYVAEKAGRRAIRERPTEPVPMAIRNAPTRLMKDLGFGGGYRYAPETEAGVAGLDCLPDGLRGERFYVPSNSGFEVELQRRLEDIAERRARSVSESRKGE